MRGGGLTKVYPGHLTHLAGVQVLVVTEGALATGPAVGRGWNRRYKTPVNTVRREGRVKY